MGHVKSAGGGGGRPQSQAWATNGAPNCPQLLHASSGGPVGAMGPLGCGPRCPHQPIVDPCHNPGRPHNHHVTATLRVQVALGPEHFPKTRGSTQAKTLRCTIFNLTQVVGFATVLLVLLVLSLNYKMCTHTCAGAFGGPSNFPRQGDRSLPPTKAKR